MKTTYKIIHTNNTAVTRKTVDWPSKPGYTIIRSEIKSVFKNPFEHVSIWWDGQELDMFVDEIGKLKNLPINYQATLMYWNATFNLRNAPLTEELLRSTIHGPAVVFDRKVWF